MYCSIYFKGPEYGTMEAAWKGILTEAERLADVHLKVKENLCAGDLQQIKTWQKDNYHKVSINEIFYIGIFTKKKKTYNFSFKSCNACI